MNRSLEPIPFVSVVLPAHNEETYIGTCLSALKSQNYPEDRFEVIVVDNKSKDRTVEIAKSYGVKVLHKDQGPVGAVRNFGARHAKGDIIGFLDSDCVAAPDWLENGAQLILSEPNTIFGGPYILRKDPYWLEKFWLLEDRDLPKSLLGGAIFINKNHFFSVGAFSESITSGEDSQLTHDLMAANYNVIVRKELAVVHLGNPTDIKTFFWRQVWHSENYIQNIKSSVTDPTFYIILLYISSISISAFFLASGKFTHTLPSLSFALFLPFILSAKRIKRSRRRIQNTINILPIYALDWLYLTGRAMGLFKSIGKWLRILE
ncbi:glycosyltransferase [Marinobacter adhaerens]|uniref:glycosyltransferase n=1 Tax=Marinobacter adhaerens TaxID=1033846 RepID=UPI001E5EDF7D|nr:glycosyltransferase family 2 protein [Marinobacter adhaerens]MCD1647051.1 glycosyltransferase [Marinobacter adhaerens]